MAAQDGCNRTDDACGERLLHEFRAWVTERNSQSPRDRATSPMVDMQPVDADVDVRAWRAAVRGAPGTPLADARVQLDVTVPEAYPARPPVVHCRKPIVYHPNVHPRTGRVRLDFLEAATWNAETTLAVALARVGAALGAPQLDRACHVAATRLWVHDAAAYARVARDAALRHAAHADRLA